MQLGLGISQVEAGKVVSCHRAFVETGPLLQAENEYEACMHLRVVNAVTPSGHYPEDRGAGSNLAYSLAKLRLHIQTGHFETLPIDNGKDTVASTCWLLSHRPALTANGTLDD